METEDEIYHAPPQIQGKLVHNSVDRKTASSRKDVILSLPVYSEEFGIAGKIDIFYVKEHKLVERKFHISKIYQGQIYQLWAQMLCLREMGHCVDSLAIYETSSNTSYPIDMPSQDDILQFKEFIEQFKLYDPAVTTFKINCNKCIHCIYCNLCDKTEEDYVVNQ